MPSYSGFMRATTWRPMASVRPVVRMGIGVSDMMDLVVDLDRRLPPSSSAEGLRQRYMYSCENTFKGLMPEPMLHVPNTSEALLVSKLESDAKTMP